MRLLAAKAAADVPKDSERWVLAAGERHGEFSMYHLDGVDWYDAPVPPKRHTCTPQSYGWMRYFDLVERCACGAIRSHGSRRWDERNSRSVR